MDKELLIECFNDTLKMSKSGAFGNSPKLVSKVFNEVIKFMPLFSLIIRLRLKNSFCYKRR